MDLGLEGNEASDFLAKRASVLMLGFGVLLLLARNIDDRNGRFAVSSSVAVCMLGLAYMSGSGILRGLVGGGMIPPLVIEILVGLSFVFLAVSNSKEKSLATKVVEPPCQ